MSAMHRDAQTGPDAPGTPPAPVVVLCASPRAGGNSDLAGQAAGVIQAATMSTEAVIAHFQIMVRQLRTVCFCTNSANLAALRRAPLQPFD